MVSLSPDPLPLTPLPGTLLPSASLTSAQLSRYAAEEGRAPEPHTVGGYSAVEFIVGAFEKAGTLDAGAAAQQAHQNGVSTLVGDLTFDARGNLLTPEMHFFQVGGRQFGEAFARVVGTPPQASQAATGRTRASSIYSLHRKMTPLSSQASTGTVLSLLTAWCA